jgi:hypothetical protein
MLATETWSVVARLEYEDEKREREQRKWGK